MTKNLDNDGFRSIADDYDLFYIDLWGVIHNGIRLHKEAILTLKKILEIKKEFVLLTNAPRPNQTVKVFLEKMGGEVIYFGKPYPEVYNQSINNINKKILSIGDNLNTDIKGANLLNFDSLIISNGIHKNEIKENGIEKTSKSYETICNYIQSELKW